VPCPSIFGVMRYPRAVSISQHESSTNMQRAEQIRESLNETPTWVLLCKQQRCAQGPVSENVPWCLTIIELMSSSEAISILKPKLQPNPEPNPPTQAAGASATRRTRS